MDGEREPSGSPDAADDGDDVEDDVWLERRLVELHDVLGWLPKH